MRTIGCRSKSTNCLDMSWNGRDNLLNGGAGNNFVAALVVEEDIARLVGIDALVVDLRGRKLDGMINLEIWRWMPASE